MRFLIFFNYLYLRHILFMFKNGASWKPWSQKWLNQLIFNLLIFFFILCNIRVLRYNRLLFIFDIVTTNLEAVLAIFFEEYSVFYLQWWYIHGNSVFLNKLDFVRMSRDLIGMIQIFFVIWFEHGGNVIFHD